MLVKCNLVHVSVAGLTCGDTRKKNAQGFIPKQVIGLQKFVSQVTSHRYAEAQVLLCCQGESCGSAHAQVIGG